MIVSRSFSLFLVGLLGCDDQIFTPHKGGGTVTGDGFCAVKSVFAAECLSCHSASAQIGGLDLETDPWTALVDADSVGSPGKKLVVAGDAAGSLLFRKMSGSQAGDEGGVMPPSGAVAAASLSAVETWINDGASAECGDTGTIPTGEGYHPDGWADPGEHGMAAKYQEDACLTCHGEDLSGGTVGVSCDTCHAAGWREDCTFCHGGNDGDLTGAPPRDIDNQAVNLSFPAHQSHVTEGIHTAWDCTQCHVKPENVLSPGHFLVTDSTPAVAETVFTQGLSPAASWSGTGCSNLYCHGNGQGDNGAVQATDTVACGDCHAVRASGEDAWDRMSGEHDKHLEEAITCSECHADTVSSAEEIISPTLHVNGTVDLNLPAGMSRNGNTCSGTCHGENHSNRNW